MPLVGALRTVAATVTAVLAGTWRMATRRESESIELHAGDPAPDFALPGSDGRTYRLRDAVGKHAVVLAWFPKAFTGG